MGQYQAARKPVIIFTLLLSVAAASAQTAPVPVFRVPAPPIPAAPVPAQQPEQPSQAPAQQSALATEKVTVFGTKEREEIIRAFATSFAVRTHVVGKIARWETGICPTAAGLSERDNTAVTERLKEVAAKVGAPVSTDKSCKTNIEIVFTTTPQALIDDVKKNQENFLGYHDGPEERDRLATVTHPIQAWYTTATQDLRGKVQIDVPPRLRGGVKIMMPCGWLGLTPKNALCERDAPDAILANTSGTQLGDGLRSGFYKIIIVVGPSAAGDLQAVSDYVAMLALTQPASLDSCPALPTIMSLQSKNCENHAERLTDTDMAYLEGVYKMNPDFNVGLETSQIADHMEKTLPQD